MFWGLILEPGKRYAQTIQRSFHISMASLDTSAPTDNDINPIQIEIDSKTYTLCSLAAKSTLQQSLDLNLESGTRVVFFNKGKSTAHLTGYLIPEDEDLSDFEEGDEEEEDDEDENAIVGKPNSIPNKRKLDNSLEQKAEKKLKLNNINKDISDDEDDNEDDGDSEFSDEDDESDEAPIKAAKKPAGDKPQIRPKQNQQQQKQNQNQQKKGQNNQQKSPASTPKPQQQQKQNLNASADSTPGSAKKKRNRNKGNKGKGGKTNGV